MQRSRIGMLARYWTTAALAVGCAHSPLRGADLDSIRRPAFLSRIEEEAGPRSTVFRDDFSSYQAKLKKLEAKEADRRLSVKLTGSKDLPSMTRFEVADTLRAEVLTRLPSDSPWTNVVNPAEVASLFDSYLVQEVPANPPEYERLAELGADAVVELVVEDYGMRSQAGRAGLFLLGYARAFRVSGGMLYHRAFICDEVKAGLEALDPFAVAKNPALFRDRLRQMLQSIADVVAADLKPAERRALAPEPAKVDERAAPQKSAPVPKDDDPL